MKLDDWLESTRRGQSMTARRERLANQLGVSEHTIRKWINGQRRIKDSDKLKIERISRGAVTVRDMVKG